MAAAGGGGLYCGLVYDHDADDIETLGWAEFITRQWESIFAGYRSWTGLRRIGRRWSDLIEAGLGCDQQTADRLVRAEVIDRADRDLEGSRRPAMLVQAMFAVVADLPRAIGELAEYGEMPAGQARDLLAAHARLLAHLRALGLGSAGPGGEPGARPGSEPDARPGGEPGAEPDAEYA